MPLKTTFVLLPVGGHTDSFCISLEITLTVFLRSGCVRMFAHFHLPSHTLHSALGTQKSFSARKRALLFLRALCLFMLQY